LALTSKEVGIDPLEGVTLSHATLEDGSTVRETKPRPGTEGERLIPWGPAPLPPAVPENVRDAGDTL
jgi:hypothetical protein